jgi:hypothetical protein
MYRRFGFVPAGARKDYYRDPTEDALVLWAHDIHTPEYAERLAFIDESLSSPLVVEGLVPAVPPVPAVPAVSNDSETPQEGYL